MSFGPPQIMDLEAHFWDKAEKDIPIEIQGTIVETVDELEEMLLENGFSGKLRGLDKSRAFGLKEHYIIFHIDKDYVGYYDAICNEIIVGAPKTKAYNFNRGGNMARGHKVKCGNCDSEIDDLCYERS
jgi:hypothetical protein